MPQQYHATDPNSGLEVTVTGDFPDEPDDRVRIARTSNLFTRLISTILTTSDPKDRRDRFRAIETQLDQLYHDMKNGTLTTSGEWYVGITSVKTAFPNPS